MITPRVGVSGIEFIRSREGIDEKEIVAVPLDVCRWLMRLGGRRVDNGDWMFSTDYVLTILRQEAEK